MTQSNAMWPQLLPVPVDMTKARMSAQTPTAKRKPRRASLTLLAPALAATIAGLGCAVVTYEDACAAARDRPIYALSGARRWVPNAQAAGKTPEQITEVVVTAARNDPLSGLGTADDWVPALGTAGVSPQVAVDLISEMAHKKRMHALTTTPYWAPALHAAGVSPQVIGGMITDVVLAEPRASLRHPYGWAPYMERAQVVTLMTRLVGEDENWVFVHLDNWVPALRNLGISPGEIVGIIDVLGRSDPAEHALSMLGWVDEWVPVLRNAGVSSPVIGSIIARACGTPGVTEQRFHEMQDGLRQVEEAHGIKGVTSLTFRDLCTR